MEERLVDQDAHSASKKAKRDGKRQCPNCDSRIGIRAQKCPGCKSDVKRKEKDWGKIASNSSADGNYIKEKLFNRLDQLSTVPGWTGVVFLVHENESKGGKKRLYTHSYSTRGAGVKIETAIRDKVLNSMRLFISNRQRKSGQEVNSSRHGMETSTFSSADNTLAVNNSETPSSAPACSTALEESSFKVLTTSSSLSELQLSSSQSVISSRLQPSSSSTTQVSLSAMDQSVQPASAPSTTSSAELSSTSFHELTTSSAIAETKTSFTPITSRHLTLGSLSPSTPQSTSTMSNCLSVPTSSVNFVSIPDDSTTLASKSSPNSLVSSSAIQVPLSQLSTSTLLQSISCINTVPGTLQSQPTDMSSIIQRSINPTIIKVGENKYIIMTKPKKN
ncbi:uncharacterized protein LOC135684808 [Rhopilema esculentum]|uniref:uncharacterized protein LOC135684808 n=1 Tax=Rhopilema esculentum TaxID=499914 RepID=UPI0031D1D030